jgi:hypothetical protein
MQWSTETVATVGYGDMPARANIEKIITLFWMFFGVGLYQFIIGNYTSIITNNEHLQ